MSATFDPDNKAEFDRYASSYDAMHAQSVAVSGESPEYFAMHKLGVLKKLLGKDTSRPVLDFGCGIGNLTRLLVEEFPVVHGYDPSTESVQIAQKRSPRATFFEDMEALPKNFYGSAVLANVLHHVPVENRPGLVKSIAATLGPGGKLVIFEHNPYNPLTRRAVNACPFDENAVLLSPGEVRRLLHHAGLHRVTLDYVLFFPKVLAALRVLEPRLAWFPLGAQVCAWGAK